MPVAKKFFLDDFINVEGLKHLDFKPEDKSVTVIISDRDFYNDETMEEIVAHFDKDGVYFSNNSTSLDAINKKFMPGIFSYYGKFFVFTSSSVVLDAFITSDFLQYKINKAGYNFAKGMKEVIPCGDFKVEVIQHKDGQWTLLPREYGCISCDNVINENIRRLNDIAGDIIEMYDDYVGN